MAQNSPSMASKKICWICRENSAILKILSQDFFLKNQQKPIPKNLTMDFYWSSPFETYNAGNSTSSSDSTEDTSSISGYPRSRCSGPFFMSSLPLPFTESGARQNCDLGLSGISTVFLVLSLVIRPGKAWRAKSEYFFLKLSEVISWLDLRRGATLSRGLPMGTGLASGWAFVGSSVRFFMTCGRTLLEPMLLKGDNSLAGWLLTAFWRIRSISPARWDWMARL